MDIFTLLIQNIIEHINNILILVALIILFFVVKDKFTIHVSPVPSNLEDKDALFLLFSTNKKKVRCGTVFLEVSSLPRNLFQDKIEESNERKRNNTLPPLPFEHLSALHQSNLGFVYEIHTEKNRSILQFSISKLLKSDKDLDEFLDNAEILRSAFRAMNPLIHLKYLHKSELEKGFQRPVYRLPSEMIIEKEYAHLVYEDSQDKYIGILKITNVNKGVFRKNPVDVLLDGFNAEHISASLMIFVSPRAQKSKIIKKFLKKRKSSNTNDISETYFESNKRLKGKKKHPKEQEIEEEIIGKWDISIMLLVRAKSPRKLETNLKKAETIVTAAFGRSSSVEVKRLKGGALRDTLIVVLTRYMKHYDFRATSFELANIVTFPEESHPGIVRNEIPKFETPEPVPSVDEIAPTSFEEAIQKERDSHESKKVLLGHTLWHNNIVNPVYVPLSNLSLHMVVLGETGFGKTNFVKNLLKNIYETAPELDWLIFDYKGEYAELKEIVPEIKILTPGSRTDGFKINIFDPGADSIEMHKQKLFALLYETISTISTKSEYSPQMERCLKDAISRVVESFKLGYTQKKPFDALFDVLDKIAQERKADMPTVVYSVEGIKARLDRFKNGILGNIFNSSAVSMTPSKLLNGKIIIDFSELIRLGVTKVELKFIMAIIFKYALDFALKRKSSRLRHITLIEEANLLLSTANTDVEGLFESAVLHVRSFGEGLIFVAQRPTISENILANAGIKILFRNAWESATLARYINLDKTQEEYLKTLPVGEAIAMVPEYPYPFRIILKRAKIKRKKEVSSKKEFTDVSKSSQISEAETMEVRKDDLFGLATDILDSEYYSAIKTVLELLSSGERSSDELHAYLGNTLDRKIFESILKTMKRRKLPLIEEISNNKWRLTDIGKIINDILSIELEVS